MGKLINVNDEVIKKLDILKNERGESYSQIIDACLKSSFDIDLDLVNEYFKELKRLIPNLRDIIELIRVSFVRFYKLPEDQQKIKSNELYPMITELFNEIMNLLKEG